jgi:hypothetical protein
MRFHLLFLAFALCIWSCQSVDHKVQTSSTIKLVLDQGEAWRWVRLNPCSCFQYRDQELLYAIEVKSTQKSQTWERVAINQSQLHLIQGILKYWQKNPLAHVFIHSDLQKFNIQIGSHRLRVLKILDIQKPTEHSHVSH